MGEMDAYKDIFLSESAEFIQGITDGLLALEADPNDLEPVEVVFRGAHSLKGMAAAMGYDRTSDLTHKMESLMDRVRRREIRLDGTLADLMLEAVDMVKSLIDDESEDKHDIDASALVAKLAAATDAPADSATGQSPSGPSSQPQSEAELPLVPQEWQASDGPPVGDNQLRAVVTLEESCVLKAVRAYMVIKRLSHMGTVVDTIPSARQIEDEEFELEFSVIVSTDASRDEVVAACMGVTEVLSAHVESVVATTPLVEAVAEESVAEESVAEERPRARTSIPKLSETQTVRVSIGHLDNMVDLVGELVILRARLETLSARTDNRELDDAIEEMNRISAELQHEVMQTRMVPVANIFNRFPRMVRDLARDLGKEVDFRMSGLDIELDRTVLDEIGDPIVHLLRNSVDHGIESSQDREPLGKAPKGTVRLEAKRERDNVVIRVADDGRGIDCGQVWNKAVALGLVDSGARESHSDEQVLMYTCVPGFSTAAKATKVSGRGVGMDVVKGKIEHLGGSLEIRSTPGAGSEFVLVLPLTLAIIQTLLVGVKDQTFAIPLSSVEEIMTIAEVSADTVDSAPVIVLRDGEVVPVYSLDTLLHMGPSSHRQPGEKDNIVLVGSAGARKALLVDDLRGRREIVIKPLSRMFRSTSGLGGATVLGDGTVALIIDPRTVFPGREESA